MVCLQGAFSNEISLCPSEPLRNERNILTCLLSHFGVQILAVFEFFIVVAASYLYVDKMCELSRFHKKNAFICLVPESKKSLMNLLEWIKKSVIN